MFFLFSQNLKIKCIFLVFWTPPNFVNISIFHTFPRVRWDIVATSCMLPYKCHIYLKSLWSLVFVGINQHDFVFIKVEENLVSSSIPHFCNFLTVSDILQRNAWNLVITYIEIQDQVKIWQPNLWNVTYS